MTEEYKKNLLNLISGKALDETLGSDGAEKTLSTTEYNYSSLLPTGATDIALYGVMDVPENLGNKSVLYGEYSLDNSWYGIVILIDENQTPIDVLTEFDSGTKLRPIQKMIMDDTGNIYAVDSTMEGTINNDHEKDYSGATIRFLMLNNFSLETNGGYEIKLRKAYNITGQVAVTGSTFFCRDIYKDPAGSSFVFIATRHNSQQSPIAVHLTINVGSSNTWQLYPSPESMGYDIHLYQASNVEWDGGTPNILIFAEDNTDVAYFSIIRYVSDSETHTFTTTNLYTYNAPANHGYVEGDIRLYLSFKFFSNSFGYFTNTTRLYDEDNDVGYGVNHIFLYQDGVLTQLYTDLANATFDGRGLVATETVYAIGDINDPIFLRAILSDSYEISIYRCNPITDQWGDIPSQSGTYSNGTTWEGKIVFPEEAILSYSIPEPETPSAGYVNQRFILNMMNSKEVYNLNYYFFIHGYLPTTDDGSYNVITNMSVANGYSGSYPTYDLQDTYLNSLVPSQAIATHEEGQEVVTDFARNIYNIQIDDNITTSSVEVPYNYLNSEGNQIALYSKTNLPMTSEYTMVKNRYEIVDVNFVNSISVIDNNDNAGIYNQDAANKINRYVTVGADYSYYLGKILINYTDNTQRVENINVEIDDDTHARAVALIYVDKAINSVEFVDESTQFIEGGSVLVKGFTYQTIDGSSLEVGKFYNITQPFHIE